jgi:glycosyltransferase involved in cell wall biosynthesis
MHVSVIMGVYNGEATVVRAVRSIQDQTYPDWDLVIVDDGSTDHTGAVLQELARHDERLTILTYRSNHGLASSLNLALTYARGPWIARMDADDVSMPQRLEQQVNFMKSHPEVDVLGSNALVLEGSSSQEGKLFRTLQETHAGIMSEIHAQSPFIHPTIIARQRFFSTLGGYNEKLLRSQDYDLFLRGCKEFTYHNLGVPLLYYHAQRQVNFYRMRINCLILLKAGWRHREFAKYFLSIIRDIGYYIVYNFLSPKLFNSIQRFYRSLTKSMGFLSTN